MPDGSAPPPRRATAADVPAITALVHAAYVGYAPLLGRTPIPMLTDYATAIDEHDIWLLEEDGELAALLELVARDDHLWIENVAVDPTRQGRGLGRRLLAFAEDQARGQGLPAIRLLTNERYLANIAMYERYGYRETHREPHLGTDLVHFEKALEPRLRRLPTADLSPDDLATVRALMDAAFGDDEDERFTDEDWQHALGGIHFVLDAGGAIVAHASVVERAIEVDGRPLRTGYVEAVATQPGLHGRGYGSMVMEAADAWIRERYELGMLGTGRHAFYERLGWVTWRGPAFVRAPDGPRRTPDEEGSLLVLATPSSPPLDLDAPISCEWRPGDVW